MVSRLSDITGDSAGLEAVLVMPFFVVAVTVAAAVLSSVWSFNRSEAVIERWAKRNALDLTWREYRLFFKGPFDRNQHVYRIAVRDAAGRLRTGWARCGGWFTVLHAEEVDVRWDKTPLPERRGFPVVFPTAPTPGQGRSDSIGRTDSGSRSSDRDG